MVPFLHVLVGLASFLGCVPTALADKADENRVKFEIRRAELRPGEGLTEATVPGAMIKIYLHKSPDATGEDIAEARAAEDHVKNPAVEIIFTKEGAKKMAKLSEEHIGKPVAFLVDGKVISAPHAVGKISERGIFVGRYTKQDVEKIVKSINGK